MKLVVVEGAGEKAFCVGGDVRCEGWRRGSGWGKLLGLANERSERDTL